MSKYFKFNHKSKDYEFTGETTKEIFGPIIDFLKQEGYNFTGNLHDAFGKKLVTIDEINNSPSWKERFRRGAFYKLKNYNKYISIGTNIGPTLNFVKNMLINFGVDPKTIETKGFEKSDEFNKKINISENKYSYIEAAQIILKKNNNKPMSANEIWDQIEKEDLVETTGLTPRTSLASKLSLHSENSTASNKRNAIFKIVVEDRPQRFILLNPNSDIQSIEDEDNEELTTPSKKQAFRYPENDVLDFKQFRAVQSEPEVEVKKERKKNPFGGFTESEEGEDGLSSAIFVLGESGVGKSTTIVKILNKEDHIWDSVAPSQETSSLLYEFEPKESSYVLTSLGEMIIDAFNNPDKLYTAIFDECHRSHVIQMINTELLQAISKKRNMGIRYISLGTVASKSFKELEVFKGRNFIIPDNLGFIFISSKPKITNNPDFYNRVYFITLTKEDRNIESIKDLIKKKEEKIYSNVREENP